MATNQRNRSIRAGAGVSQPQPARGSALRRTTARQLNRRRTSTRRRMATRRQPTRQRGRAVSGAQNQLKKFKQGSMLAIAITGFLLMLFAPDESGYGDEGMEQASAGMLAQNETPATEQEQEGGTETIEITQEGDTLITAEEEEVEEPITRATKDQAVGAVQRLWNSFYRNLPKILVALVILFIAWLVSMAIRWLLKKAIGQWERSGATIAMINIILWLFAIGVAISVLVGDIRAMVGSLGLIGLALSWSLQSPIESFTGWLFNSFKGYYRIGDRISVGDVVGDVYKIDFLTTTVWEIGSPYRQGYLQAEQPTGRLVTFPNNEVLAGSVVNYTSDFPYVWDELMVAVANESDIRLAMEVMEGAANQVLVDYMQQPAREYSRILQRAGLPDQVAEKPQVFLSMDDSWTNVIIRYLVGARERRAWKTKLIVATAEAANKPEYKGKIIPVYPRQQLQLINSGGAPVTLDNLKDE